MRTNFTSRHFKAPESLKTFAETKVKKLTKYYGGIISCDIVLDREKLLQVADISVSVNSQYLRVVEKSDDSFKSIELAVDKLERKLKKFKNKQRDHSGAKPPVEE